VFRHLAEAGSGNGQELLSGSVKKNGWRGPTHTGVEKEKTSFVIVDALSVKNIDTVEERGYDAGKRVSVIKRHIAVDMQGLPHAIHITTVNLTDRNGAIDAFVSYSEKYSEVKKALIDGGYF
jgi:hypothetical protein